MLIFNGPQFYRRPSLRTTGPWKPGTWIRVDFARIMHAIKVEIITDHVIRTVTSRLRRDIDSLLSGLRSSYSRTP